ncbi:MAG TPA: hypothetical protein VME47_24800 [Acetobacteraceae bacterium]|nr:hypothetical protein [Acetobacteraceae bacterium]
MPETVDVAIPVEAEAARALADARKREAVGRIVSRLLRPQPGHDPLLDAMRRLSTDAAAKGLTPAILERELADHTAGRCPG